MCVYVQHTRLYMYTYRHARTYTTYYINYIDMLICNYHPSRLLGSINRHISV